MEVSDILNKILAANTAGEALDLIPEDWIVSLAGKGKDAENENFAAYIIPSSHSLHKGSPLIAPKKIIALAPTRLIALKGSARIMLDQI